MKLLLPVLLTVYAHCLLAEDAEFTQDNGVYVLTDSNFDAFLDQNPTALVEFYAPWCGHCKKLAPEYEKAAETMKSKEPPIPLAKVDTTVEKELGTKYDIKGFPTLKLWKEGNPMDYDGPRDAEGIVEWLVEKTDPNYKPPPEAVITLTQENFADIALNADLILVEFYAPWCGHCKKLAPEYEKAAQRLKASTPSIPLGKVDATKESDLAKEYGVSGYPTLKILRKGKRYDYNGPREADGIVSYMKEQAQPAARLLAKAKTAPSVLSKDDVTVIAFVRDHDGLRETFDDAAEALREEYSGKLFYVIDSDVEDVLRGRPGSVGVYMPEQFWSKYEKKVKVLDKPTASKEDIMAFVSDSRRPLVGQRTRDNKESIYSARPLCVVYYTVNYSHEHREGTEYWRKMVVEVAKDYPQYTFAISDDEQFSKEVEEVGLGDSGQDVNVACFGADGRKYPRDPDEDDFSVETFREFMEQLNTGHVKPYIRSAPVPKDDKGPVKVVVGANFDAVVRDETKDVLIEMYAPWCGHCKALEPKYKELAAKLKKTQPNLVIAKCDATANDLPPDYKAEGFPTIYFAPSGKKNEPIRYDGGRTVADFEKFLKEHGVVSFKKTEL